MRRGAAAWLLGGLLVAGLSGCASTISQGLADGVSRAVANADDPAMVEAGVPAYALLLDGMIADSPDDPDLLMAGARLQAAYAVTFVEAGDRQRRLTDKARDYGRRALCLEVSSLCGLDTLSLDDLRTALADLDDDAVPALFSAAESWAAWIRAHSDDWQAVADLPTVEVMLERVVAMDEDYRKGAAHHYLGIIRSQRPPALGGRPETGRAHFERALALSAGHNLAAKVDFAETYARLVFDRALHDRLLREVLDAEPRATGWTLSNTLAQHRARRLLEESSDYFPE